MALPAYKQHLQPTKKQHYQGRGSISGVKNIKRFKQLKRQPNEKRVIIEKGKQELKYAMDLNAAASDGTNSSSLLLRGLSMRPQFSEEVRTENKVKKTEGDTVTLMTTDISISQGNMEKNEVDGDEGINGLGNNIVFAIY